MFFGMKKPDTETVLLLDVESGSVGAALALLALNTPPTIFGEVRVALPAAYHSGTASLLPQIEKAAREALAHTAQVAANLRTNDTLSGIGIVSRAAVFLSAPWGAPNLAEGKQRYVSSLQKSLTDEIDGYLGVESQYYTGADSAAYALGRLLPAEQLLACIVRGEATELLLMGERDVRGYATIPTGFNTTLRTLRSHAGMSIAEAVSALALAAHPSSEPYEPLDAAGRHFVSEFADAAQHLLAGGDAQGIFVIAPEAAGDWFARTLGSDESLADYFPDGATVRALRAHHLRPHVSGRSVSTDLHLLLAGLFVEGANRAVY